MLKNDDLATGSYDQTIKIWDIENGTVKKTLTGHTNCINRLILLENNDLVSGSTDKTIKIWNLEDGTVKRTLTGHTNTIWSLILLNPLFTAVSYMIQRL